jgi:hypothetical protein
MPGRGPTKISTRRSHKSVGLEMGVIVRWVGRVAEADKE